jgi:toxin ParE1/3/4
MEFRVRLSRRSERDVAEAFAFIQSDSEARAVRWRVGLERVLRKLQSQATIHGFAPENQSARCEVRQILFGRYRILYTIQENVAFVLTIRHGARQFLSRKELDAILGED